MPIKAVFFDMGETLCYQSPSTVEIVGDFLRGRGIRRTEKDLRRAYLAAMTFFSTWAMRIEMNQRTDERREEMVGQFYRVMMTNLALADHMDMIPAMRETVLGRRERPFNALYRDVLPALEALRCRDFRLGIISNWDHTLADTVHELGLTRYFDTVVASANIGVEKPNAIIFHHALARLALAPHEACHVGDIYYMDVLGARAAGVRPVLIDRHGLHRDLDCLRAESLTEVLSLLDEVNE